MARSIEELAHVRMSQMTQEERRLVVEAAVRKLKAEFEDPGMQRAIGRVLADDHRGTDPAEEAAVAEAEAYRVSPAGRRQADLRAMDDAQARLHGSRAIHHSSNRCSTYVCVCGAVARSLGGDS